MCLSVTSMQPGAWGASSVAADNLYANKLTTPLPSTSAKRFRKRLPWRRGPEAPGPAAVSAKINARAKAFQQKLVSAEADEAVDRSLIPLRQGRSAAGRTLQPTALGPPSGQPLVYFFATWREQARPW
jgi:hypothetical protein